MILYVSNVLNRATHLLFKNQADQLRGLVTLWINHVQSKGEGTITLDWGGVMGTNSHFMDQVFTDIQEQHSAYAISRVIKHVNYSEAVASELRRIFDYQTKYNTDTNYQLASNHIWKELSTLGPKK